MQELTIITTYYNEKELLERFIQNYLDLKTKYSFKLIVVDDGSLINPAYDIVCKYDDITLLRVTEDLGFNSHGARNLGMQHSATDWNFLVDVDCDISSLDYEKIMWYPFDNYDVYSFHTNSLIIHKDTFWSCKGYDEDFVGLHYGDRFFLIYLEQNFNFIQIKNNELKKYRPGWKVVFVDNLEKDYYKGNTLYMRTLDDEANAIKTNTIKSRYIYKDFSTKTIINFKWEKLLPVDKKLNT